MHRKQIAEDETPTGMEVLLDHSVSKIAPEVGSFCAFMVWTTFASVDRTVTNTEGELTFSPISESRRWFLLCGPRPGPARDFSLLRCARPAG